TFQHKTLSRDILFQAKRPETCDLTRWHIQSPGTGELSFLVKLIKQMSRKHCDAVKDSFGSRVGLGEFESHRELIKLYHADRFAVDHQKVTLHRVHLLVEINLEGKDNVACIKAVAIGKLYSAPQLQRIFTLVGRSGPRYRQGRFGKLRAAVNADQIG